MKDSILLVGGCGFLGRSLATYFHSVGESVRIFDRPGNVEKMKREAPWFTYHSGDFRSFRASSAAALQNVGTVVHLVHSSIPATSMDNVEADAAENILASIRLMDDCRRAGVQRFVFVSSGGTVYGIPRMLPVSESDLPAPICAYGVSKLAIEKYVDLYTHTFGWDGIVVRVANPYGAYQLRGTPVGVIANFLLQVKSGAPLIIWGDGSVVRDYVYIDDAVRAMHSLVIGQARPGTYNLGAGVGHSLLQVAQMVGRVCGVTPQIEYLPKRRIDVPEIILNTSKLGAEIGWAPSVCLSEGIGRLWEKLLSSNDTELLPENRTMT